MNEKKLTDLNALQEKFYAMFGRLWRNRKLLDGEKTFKRFAANLVEQYEAEYDAFKTGYELEELPELEKLKQRHFALVPRKYRPWYFLWLFKRRNRALKNIDREIYIELEQHFRKKEAALERLEKLLENSDSADKQTTAFDEPKESEQGAETSERTIEIKTDPRASDAQAEPEKAGKTAAKAKTKPKDNGQVPGQMTLDDVQANTEPKKP